MVQSLKPWAKYYNTIYFPSFPVNTPINTPTSFKKVSKKTVNHTYLSQVCYHGEVVEVESDDIIAEDYL